MRKRIVYVWYDYHGSYDGTVGCYRAQIKAAPYLKGAGLSPDAAFCRCVNAAIAKKGMGNPTTFRGYRRKNLP